MRAEMWGGPLDGQTVNVPAHLNQVRFPVPGSATLAPPKASIAVAVYDRLGTKLSNVDEDVIVFRFTRQEGACTE